MNALRMSVVFACAATLLAAPVPKDIDPQPTAAQLAAAKEAFAKFSGLHTQYTDERGRLRHRFTLHQSPTDADLAALPRPSFRYDLYLDAINLSDAGMAAFAGNKRLEALTLTRLKHVDEGLKHLAKLEGLTELSLTGNHLTVAGVRHVGRLKNFLTRLELSGSEITDECVKELVGLGQLTHLDLNKTNVTDACLKHVRGFPKLRHLDLSLDPNDTVGKGVSDDGLKELLALPELRTLNLRYTSITDAGLKTLGKLKTLTELDLFSIRATNAGVRQLIADLPGLTKLNLGRVKLTDAGTVGLEKLEHLTSLCLSHTDVGEATLVRVGRLKRLAELNLYYSEKVTDVGVKSLRGLEKLAALNLGNTAITNAALTDVAKFKGLKAVGLATGVGPIRVTKEGEAGLQKARPDLTVHTGHS